MQMNELISLQWQLNLRRAGMESALERLNHKALRASDNVHRSGFCSVEDGYYLGVIPTLEQ